MHFDEEMGFQHLGPGITVLSPSDPRPPTVRQRIQKRVLMKSHGKHLRRSFFFSCIAGEGSTAIVQNEGFGETQKEAPTREPSVRKVPRKVRMDMIEQEVVEIKRWPLVWTFLVKSHITMRYLLRGKPSSN